MYVWLQNKSLTL